MNEKIIDELTPLQKQIYELNRKGFTQQQIARELMKTQQLVSSTLLSVKKKGLKVTRWYRSQRKTEKEPQPVNYIPIEELPQSEVSTVTEPSLPKEDRSDKPSNILGGLLSRR